MRTGVLLAIELTARHAVRLKRHMSSSRRATCAGSARRPRAAMPEDPRAAGEPRDRCVADAVGAPLQGRGGEGEGGWNVGIPSASGKMKK